MQRHPILYSFRRCPYAMRARLAIYASGVTVELREVLLKDKPAELLNASPKGTVPVLVINQETILDESIDIMRWALEQTTQHDWLSTQPHNHQFDADSLIEQNDTEFKYYLDRYKYFDRHPEHSQQYYLDKAIPFLNQLEETLSKQSYLDGNAFRFTDAAIAPFIRQLYLVDTKNFEQLDLPKLKVWLNTFLTSNLFSNIMEKHPPWSDGDPKTLFKSN